MNWLPLERSELDAQNRARIEGPRAAHLHRVLRVVVGTTLRALVVGGERGRAVVEAVETNSVTVRCEFFEPPPPPLAVALLIGMPRPKAMKRLWPQLAAMGAPRVMVVGAAHSEASYLRSHALAPDVVRRLCLEGLAQSGETRPPAVSVHPRLDAAMLRAAVLECAEHARFVADPSFPAASNPSLPAAPVVFAVGPEGGWTTDEISLLRNEGFLPWGLGPRVLRTDTACIALLALAQAAAGRGGAAAP